MKKIEEWVRKGEFESALQEAQGGYFYFHPREKKAENGNTKTPAGVSAEIVEKVESYYHILNFISPDWYPGDYELLQRNKNITHPIIISIIKNPPDKGASGEKRAWVQEVRTKLINYMVDCKAEETEDLLIELLKDQDVEIRISALEGLGRIGTVKSSQPIADYLLEERIPDYTSHKGLEERMRAEETAKKMAVGILVSLGDTSCAEPFIKEYKTQGLGDRLIPSLVLTGFRSEKFLDIYRDMLKDSNLELRIYSASALKDMGYDDGFSTLNDIFKTQDIGFKLWIFEVYSMWKDKNVNEFYINYLKEQSNQNQNQDLGYIPLPQLGKKPPLLDISDPRMKLFVAIIQELIDRGNDSCSILINYINKKDNDNENGSFKFIVIEILGEAGYKPALPILRENLKSPDPQIKYYSLWALGRMKDKESLPAIKLLLRDKNHYVQIASAWALSSMGDDSGENRLIEIINEKVTNPSPSVEDENLVSSCLEALYYLRKPQYAKVLQGILQSKIKDSYVIVQSVKLLGIIRDKSSIHILEDIKKQYPQISYYVEETIYRINGNENLLSHNGDNGYYTDEAYTEETYHKKTEYSYGDGDYCQYPLLFLSMFPERFGKTPSVISAKTTLIKTYGKYAIEQKSSQRENFIISPERFKSDEGNTDAGILTEVTRNMANDTAYNPIEATDTPDKSDKNIKPLEPGRTALVEKFSGRWALLHFAHGDSGWVPNRGIIIDGKALLNLKERLMEDYGSRNNIELSAILEKDYLSGMKIRINNSEPCSEAGYIMMRNLWEGEAVSLGIPPSAMNWDEILDKYNDNIRTIEMEIPWGETTSAGETGAGTSTGVPSTSKTFIFGLDSQGRITSFSLKKPLRGCPPF